MKYEVTRELTDREKYDTSKDIKKGDIIYRFKGYTYGCISSGQACSLIEGKNPFFEMPLDSIKEII